MKIIQFKLANPIERVNSPLYEASLNLSLSAAGHSPFHPQADF